jgi:hypothetical protein
MFSRPLRSLGGREENLCSMRLTSSNVNPLALRSSRYWSTCAGVGSTINDQGELPTTRNGVFRRYSRHLSLRSNVRTIEPAVGSLTGQSSVSTSHRVHVGITQALRSWLRRSIRAALTGRCRRRIPTRPGRGVQTERAGKCPQLHLAETRRGQLHRWQTE